MPKNLLVVLGAAFFIVYGVAFIFAPTAMASFITGAAPAHPSSMIDFRATYGGMTLGVGLILAICALIRPTSRPFWTAIIGRTSRLSKAGFLAGSKNLFMCKRSGAM